LTTILELAEICGIQVDAPVKISDTGSGRPARIINWVDDQRARRELGHMNNIPLSFGIAEIVEALQ
jgi:nucleoside-diphosphate-sugar epimerase